MTDLVAGRYQIVRRLGSGGMAVVYLAHDPLLGRDVAIKVPRLDDDAEPDAIERFQAELRAIGRLNHPNIVTIYDGGDDGGRPYLVMEPVDGESLALLIRREGHLPADRAVDIARQAAEALAYAHGQGLIHRDVKPQNILVAASGRVKVTDFGIARSSEVTRTLTGTVLGTPSYMAPEVSAGERATAQSDIYSLGVVLYQMLTGHTPFESENAIATALRSQREDAAPPSHLVSAPAWLDAIVLKALARDPSQRYQTASALAEDLLARRAPAKARVVVASRPAAEERTQRRPAVAAPPTQKRPRRSRWWMLPVIVIVAACAGVAWAATHAPQHASAPPAASAAATSPTPSPVNGGTNLLANGNFAAVSGGGPTGWHRQTFEGAEAIYRYGDPGPTANDRAVLFQTSRGTYSAWVGSNVGLRPGAKATLTGYVKTDSVPPDGSGAGLRLVCEAADGSTTGQADSPVARGTTNWQQVQATMTVPAQTVGCFPMLRLGDAGHPTTGTVAFSAISLVSDQPPTATVAEVSPSPPVPQSRAAAPEKHGHGKDG